MELHSITFPGLPEQYKVAPASHLDDKNNPHGVTPEQIGAAPAGYGLGGEAKQLTSVDNLDNIWESGWYHWNARAPANAPIIKWDANFGKMYVDGTDTTTFTQTVQTKYNSSDSRGIEVRRTFTNGVTDGWEWVNPPMALGVEYRTTKRHKGKVVYAKAISIGKMPVSSARYDNLVTGVDEVVDYIFTMSSYQERYTNNSHVKTLGRNTSAGSVFAEIVTDVNISTFDAYLTISYTKV